MFCEFHGEVGHNTDECMHLKRQIEELIKAGKMSHVIKELKQGNGKDQPKTTKTGEASGKDKPLAILMVQPWKKVARQRIAQSFSLDLEISFPPLEEEDRTEAPMIIEAEIGGHFIHWMYVDGGSASEILYEHCFSKLRPEVKRQMVPATTPPHWFQRRDHMADGSNSTTSKDRWPRVRKMQAVPSTAYGVLKYPVLGGIVTLRSSKIIPLECTMVSGSEAQSFAVN
ncbi:hypothetical protein Tco_1184826 [Tanacetum coccineum]